MRRSALRAILFFFAIVQFNDAFSADCLFKLRKLITVQKTDMVQVNYKVPTIPKNGALSTFFSSSKNNGLIDGASDIKHFFRNIETAINDNSIATSYLFTSEKWDDQGLSKVLNSSLSIKSKMSNGKSLYLLKNQYDEIQLFGEVLNSFSGVFEIHKIGGAKFNSYLKELENRNLLRLKKVDSYNVGNSVNIDKYGTDGIVDIANSYIKAYDQLSAWSYTNSDRIDIVKSAYRYMIDLQRSGKIRTKPNSEDYVQKTIDRVKEINESSRISSENATDLVYESLSMNINAKLMIKIYRHAYNNISGDRYYYMTFLNSMFSNIKIRNLKGENISINETNWESTIEEYLVKYNSAVKEAGFWGDAMSPMMFAYSMLKSSKYDENIIHAKKVIKEIYDVIGNEKISGAILLLARGMKIDEDIDKVLNLARTIDRVYNKTSHDKGGAVLMGEVAEKESLSVEQVKKEYDYLYENVSLGNSETIGEAIYLGRKLNINFNEIMHSMNELHGRLYTHSSIDAQGVIDLLETLRLKKQVDAVANEAHDETQEINENIIINTIDDVIEEVADDTLNTILLMTIAINIAS